MKPEGGGIMVDDLGEADPSEFFAQLGMLILESRQPSTSIRGRQDGPHCPKDVGVWSGHVCASNSAQCSKANQILKQMQMLWRNHVPLCIEVLILPSCVHGQQRCVSTDVTPPYEDDGYVLLEQWTIQTVPKKPGEAVVSPKNLFQAMKSYLHFSQLSSWLSSSQGMRPSCIGYRVSPPAEFCTSTFTQDPQLHVFPVGGVNKSTNFKVWLAYLSRMPEIPEPICHEISETGHQCFFNINSKHASQETLSKKQMPRSASPHLRFEAVFQNITGSPKLISKSCGTSSVSRQHSLIQQCHLASITKGPLQYAPEHISKNILNEPIFPFNTKDDAYGIGVSDIKSQCENNVCQSATFKETVWTHPEKDMRSFGISTNELAANCYASKDFDWCHQYPCDEQPLGNCNSFSVDTSNSLPSHLVSKQFTLPLRTQLHDMSENASCRLVDNPKMMKPSEPINISPKDGRPGTNYAHMLLKDQSATDSENSSSPDIDLFLSETLAKRAEPMNPEEMYEYLSRLCKKKLPGSKLFGDDTYQVSSKPIRVCQLKDIQPLKNELPNTKRDLMFKDGGNLIAEKFSSDIHVNCDCKKTFKYNENCDNIVDLAESHSVRSKSCSCFRDIFNGNPNHEGVDSMGKKYFLLSETLELLESLKYQTSSEKCKNESADSDARRPVFSLGDSVNGGHPICERSHQNETQEYKQVSNNKSKDDPTNSPICLDSLLRNKQNSSSPSLNSFQFQELQIQWQKDMETTQTRPLSAIPRRLQSKTPQDSKHSPLLFMDSPRNQKTPFVKILNSGEEDAKSEDDLSSNSTFKEGVSRIPSKVEKELFMARVQHSSSMVFNMRTKLPMQSSPVPAKRLSSGCFDYDSSLNSVQAIKNSFSCNNLDDAQNSSNDCIRLKQAFSSSAPASTNCLLGNFEESLINGRIQPAGLIDGFTAEIGASGSFCPSHLTLPCLAFFFSLSEDSAPSPYLGHINLESQSKRGYKVPNKGTVQVTLFNPNKSVVKIYVVTYDVSDMPPNHQTLLRQKTVYMPTPGSPSDVPGAPVYLRYLIHLRFASSKHCKIYLHTDIRLIFARDRFELDNRIYHYELRSFTETPENPKYSPKK